MFDRTTALLLMTTFAGCAALATIGATRAAANPPDDVQSAGESPHELSPGVAGEQIGAGRAARNAECHAPQLWYVSTRGMSPSCPTCDVNAIRYEVRRANCQSGWTASSLDDFLGSGDGMLTLVFVHGNNTSEQSAMWDGEDMCAQIAKYTCATMPTRFVIYSWPSDHEAGIRRDLQLKACRTNLEAFYLAAFLDRLGPQAPVSLLGYSFGARVTTGALHILGGGAIEGRQLPQADAPRDFQIRTVLMAGAVADSWLLPGRPHDRALSQVDRMVVLVNPEDHVLRWFPLLCGRGGPDAVGYTGVQCRNRLGPDAAKVYQINVTDIIQRGHGWKHYVRAVPVLSRVGEELLDPSRPSQRQVFAPPPVPTR